MTTFIFEGTEVKKTGRTAVKQIHGVGKPGRIFTLFEITPVDSFAGDWKKWSRDEDLFTVVEVDS